MKLSSLSKLTKLALKRWKYQSLYFLCICLLAWKGELNRIVCRRARNSERRIFVFSFSYTYCRVLLKVLYIRRDGLISSFFDLLFSSVRIIKFRNFEVENRGLIALPLIDNEGQTCRCVRHFTVFFIKVVQPLKHFSFRVQLLFYC